MIDEYTRLVPSQILETIEIESHPTLLLESG